MANPQLPNGNNYDGGFAKQAPNHTFAAGSGINGTFIPELWASRLLTDLESGLVFGGLTNRTYEGELRGPGDVVKVPHVLDSIKINGGTLDGKGGVNSGAAYAEIDHFDRLNNDFIELRVDQARTWGFEVDNLHQVQTKGIALMSQLTGQSARNLAENIDSHIVSTIKSGLQGKDLNWGDIPLHGKVSLVDATDSANHYGQILRAQTVLNIRNVSTAGRVLVVGPEEYADLLEDPKFIDAGHMGDGTSIMRTGVVGTILGLPVIVSNTIGRHLDDANAYKDATFVREPKSGANGIYGVLTTREAVSFAHTLSDLESFRPERKFTDAVKGRMIFGAKIVRPEQMIVLGNPELVGEGGEALKAPAAPQVKTATK
jgi:hypothetical protein